MLTDYDKIRENNIREYGEGIRHLSFLGRLYTDRTHFIFELLQNAEDAGATRILFSLFHDRLEITHDGRPFNERDVIGVCGVGEGTKTEDLTQIGKFGIGFKSVYAYTATPEVHSGGEGFRIENYVRPYTAPPKPPDKSWTTLFLFPFNAEEITPETACTEIGGRLRNLSARTLLFLRKINEIEYRLPDLTGGVYLRKEIARGSGRQVSVIGQTNGKDEEENWLIFERPVPVPGSSESVRVEVSFRLEAEDKTGKNPERIIKVKDSPLVVYFPTEKATRFGFLIQGPYRTTPSRDNIPKGDEWNETLVRETAELIDEVLSEIKDIGLLSISFLEALPIRTEDFPDYSMFSPIVESVRNTLIEKELLPANDGSFVSAGNAKLARGADLRTLLSSDQLYQLFQSSVATKWLSWEITRDRTSDLRSYLINKLNVEEVNPESLAKIINHSFLFNQPDEWFIAFYRYLSGQEALWRAPRWKGDSSGLLRLKPIVRLNDGTQVNPFRYDGSPSAYLVDDTSKETSLPTVKMEISRDKDAFNFLKRIGIPEFDLVAEIIERILPKYRTGSIPVSPDEHMDDITAIDKAYATDSQEKKKRLQQSLIDTPFVRTERNHDSHVIYKRPRELYFATDELRPYFLDNESIGFVDSLYSESVCSILKELGVRSMIKIECKSANGSSDHVRLDHHIGHRRGLNGFDPDIEIDGLAHALLRPSVQKSRIIWNKIGVPYSRCIKGKVLESSRQDFSPDARIYDEEEMLSEKFGRLLIDATWLPDALGNFKKPCDLKLDDLPDSFIRDKTLAHQLEMKLDVVVKLAEEAGLKPETLEMARHMEAATPEQRVKINEILGRGEIKVQAPFPTRPVVNPERRQERLDEDLSNAPDKEYEKRKRTIRTTNGAIDPVTWLRNQYTNEDDQMVCQICKEEMPFRKRNGTHYFEKKEVLSRKYLPKEHEAQYLALCPLCAAKYEEFVKTDDDNMAELKKVLVNAKDCEVPISLGDQKTSIRFVEKHYHDLKAIVCAME